MKISRYAFRTEQNRTEQNAAQQWITAPFFYHVKKYQ